MNIHQLTARGIYNQAMRTADVDKLGPYLHALTVMMAHSGMDDREIATYHHAVYRRYNHMMISAQRAHHIETIRFN